MTPNLKAGKTEILMSIRGKGSRKLKTKYFGTGAIGTMPIVTNAGVQHIQVVANYTHLGAIIHHSVDCNAELRRRLGIGHQTFNQQRKLILQNPHIQWTKRKELFDSLIMSKILYGIETWNTEDKHIHTRLNTGILKLYRRMLRLRPQDHHYDAQVIAQGEFLEPIVLARRARLRFLVTLYKCEHLVPWDLFHRDAAWTQALQEDLLWMYAQLHNASDLPDPTCNFRPWLHILKQFPRYWKRLVNRACEHSKRQFANNYLVRRFHADIMDELEKQGTFSRNRPKSQIQPTKGLFGCPCCGVRCKTKAGERVHMFRKHGQQAAHRVFFDQTVCPCCLKEFHTIPRISNHLRHHAPCREVLQGRHQRCHPVPGHGAAIEVPREQQAKGLKYPQQTEGPSLPQDHRVAIELHHQELYGFLGERMLDTDTDSIPELLKNFVMENCLPWSQYVMTLQQFYDDYSTADEEASGIALDKLGEVCDAALSDKLFPFLLTPCEDLEPNFMDLADYEAWMIDICNTDAPHWTTENSVPKLLGKHRIFLHLYSGRRRPGDVQYYLDRLAEARSDICIWMVSVDIVIDTEWGDVSRETTRVHWLEAARRGWILAVASGPPCNTWSRARNKKLLTVRTRRTPRPVRDAEHLWGKESLTLGEFIAVHTGNLLLGYSLQLMVIIALHSGHGFLEHPSEPKEPGAPSIWKLPLVNLILGLPGFELIQVAQGLYGAKSPKPTTLLVLNLPNMRSMLHAGMITKELPQQGSIGLNENQEFQTSSLKEYPPALCRAIARTFFEHLASPSLAGADEPDERFLDKCKEMTCTQYGTVIGPDFAPN